MNKKIKIISSLAVAGMLATAGITGTVNAATTTKTLGIYQNLVAGTKNAVPFVLANRDDKVTVKDIKDSGKFSTITSLTRNGKTVAVNDNTVVFTGDEFVSGGVKYTAIVFGDVNKDGNVNVLDAVLLVKGSMGVEGKKLDNIQKAAADINSDKAVNVIDAVKVAQFGVGNTNVLVNPEPAEEKPVTDYTLSINQAYLNNVSIKDFDLSVELPAGKTLSKDTALKIKVLDKDGKRVKSAGNDYAIDITIPARTELYTEEGINFSSLGLAQEGTITIQLIQVVKGEDTILDYITVPVNTVAPVVSKVSTNRVDTKHATMSFENAGEDTIVSMDYVVDTTATNPASLTGATTIDGLNNKLENVEIMNDGIEGQAYYVHYTVTNSYGSVSSVKTATIATSSTVAAVAEIDKVEAPANKTTSAVFTVTLKAATPKATEYVAYLYNDGKLVKELEPAALSTGSEANVTSFTVDMADAIEEAGAGKYTVGIIIKGAAAGTTKDSAEVKSEGVIEVSKLQQVSNVAIAIEDVDGTPTKFVNWTPNTANAETNVDKYVVTIKDADGNALPVSSGVTTFEADADKTKVEIPSAVANAMLKNKVYTAEVAVKAKAGQIAILSSDAKASNGFFEVAPVTNATVITDITDTSLTINLAEEIEINEEKATYYVDLWEYREEKDDLNQTVEKAYKLDRKQIALNDDNQLVVTKLTPGTKYELKVVAKVGDVTGESALITKTATDGSVIKTLNAAPNIVGYTMVAAPAANETQANKTIIKAANGDLTIKDEAGKEYSITSATKATYPSEFIGMLEIVKALHEGDKVTISGKTAKIELAGNDDITLASIAKADLDLTKVTLEIKGTADETAIVTAAKADGANVPAEVILTGASLFDLSGNFAPAKITLKDTVEVKGAHEYAIVAGAKPIVYGIEVDTKTAITVDLTAEKVLDIVATVGDNNLDGLTFTNTNNGRYTTTNATINIKEKDSTTKILGTITIISAENAADDGKVTLTSQTNTSEVNLVVNVTDADVDVTGFESNSTNVNVTVTGVEDNAVTVTANVDVEAPKTLTDAELKAYTDEQIKTTFSVSTTEDVNAIKTYLATFSNLFDKGITISVDADSKEVTYTIPAGVNDEDLPVSQNVTIQGK